jgi:hypothetical protein
MVCEKVCCVTTAQSIHSHIVLHHTHLSIQHELMQVVSVEATILPFVADLLFFLSFCVLYVPSCTFLQEHVSVFAAVDRKHFGHTPQPQGRNFMLVQHVKFICINRFQCTLGVLVGEDCWL